MSSNTNRSFLPPATGKKATVTNTTASTNNAATSSFSASPSPIRANLTSVGGSIGGGPGSASSSGGGGNSANNCFRITRKEVEQAFKFLDVTNSGILRPRDLKARLSSFYPNMTNREYQFLISEPKFTVDTLWNLLESSTVGLGSEYNQSPTGRANSITGVFNNNPASFGTSNSTNVISSGGGNSAITTINFDPITEAFRVYDPHYTGFVDVERLQSIMGKMGYGELSPEDMTVLMQTTDIDGDGKISLDDFRTMIINSSNDINCVESKAKDDTNGAGTCSSSSSVEGKASSNEGINNKVSSSSNNNEGCSGNERSNP